MKKSSANVSNNYVIVTKNFHLLVIIVLCVMIFVLYSCLGNEKKVAINEKKEIPSVQQNNDETSNSEVLMMQKNDYYVPSDYDILNVPPKNVIEYLKQNEGNNIDAVLEELDIDIKKEIGNYLQEEYVTTKEKIFENVP